MTVRLLLASDSRLLREALLLALADDPLLEIVGSVPPEEVLAAAARDAPRVVLLDVVGAADRLALLTQLRARHPDAEVVALAGAHGDGHAVAAIRAGALAYVHRSDGLDALRRSVHAAAAGQVLLSPEAAARLVRELRPPVETETLTPRESEVLALVTRGRSNREIARTLGVTEKTVKTHVSHVLAKLHVGSRTQAALYALRVGLVEMDAQADG